MDRTTYYSWKMHNFDYWSFFLLRLFTFCFRCIWNILKLHVPYTNYNGVAYRLYTIILNQSHIDIKWRFGLSLMIEIGKKVFQWSLKASKRLERDKIRTCNDLGHNSFSKSVRLCKEQHISVRSILIYWYL